MGAITIRRLDDAVLEQLKIDARRNGRSMEAEARLALATAYKPRSKERNDAMTVAGQHTRLIAVRYPQDTASMLRQMRGYEPDEWDDE